MEYLAFFGTRSNASCQYGAIWISARVLYYLQRKEWETRGIWHRFCKKAAEAGEVCDLPPHLLFALSLESALNIAFKCKHFAHKSSMVMLESVIDRTWRAIQK